MTCPPRELKEIPTVLRLAARGAGEPRPRPAPFLKAGDVFADDFIDAFIELKMTEVMKFEMTPPSGRVRHVLFLLIGIDTMSEGPRTSAAGPSLSC